MPEILFTSEIVRKGGKPANIPEDYIHAYHLLVGTVAILATHLRGLYSRVLTVLEDPLLRKSQGVISMAWTTYNLIEYYDKILKQVDESVLKHIIAQVRDKAAQEGVPVPMEHPRFMLNELRKLLWGKLLRREYAKRGAARIVVKFITRLIIAIIIGLVLLAIAS